MLAYILRRLILIIPTLLGIMTINFFVIQIVPGGPVEQMIAQLSGDAVEATARFASSGTGETMGENRNRQSFDASSNLSNKYRGARGLSPNLIAEIEEMYGMDKPIHVRFFKMMIDYATFDFGDSFFQDRSGCGQRCLFIQYLSRWELPRLLAMGGILMLLAVVSLQLGTQFPVSYLLFC